MCFNTVLDFRFIGPRTVKLVRQDSLLLCVCAKSGTKKCRPMIMAPCHKQLSIIVTTFSEIILLRITYCSL